MELYNCVMTQVWWFLFDLFFLGYVEDPETGISFCMPQKHQWSFYFEVLSTVDVTYCMYCSVYTVCIYIIYIVLYVLYVLCCMYVLYVSLYVHVYALYYMNCTYCTVYVRICMYCMYVVIGMYLFLCMDLLTYVLMCVLHMHCIYVCTFCVGLLLYVCTVCTQVPIREGQDPEMSLELFCKEFPVLELIGRPHRIREDM